MSERYGKNARSAVGAAFCVLAVCVCFGGYAALRQARSASHEHGAARALSASASRGASARASRASEPLQAGAVEAASAPFDVGAIIDQVHFAYRPGDAPGRFEGGHSTYEVKADAKGATLRAYHAPRASKSRDAAANLMESATLRIQLASIERGNAALVDGGAGTPSVQQDGHLAVDRGVLVEHFRNGEGGVEQSWSFTRKPEGEGELRVRVQASGLAYTGETEHGLHFADAATGLGFRYGHGVWVDANGVRTQVPARHRNGAIELRVSASVLQGSAYPAVLDPIISPESGTDEPVVSGSMNAQTPSIASNGDGFLVAWSDQRNPFRTVIETARVSSAGVLLDPNGIEVAGPNRSPSRARVASNGSDYLVVWMGYVEADASIYGTRITSAGIVQEPEGLAISDDAPGEQANPSVASNGEDYLVAWQDARTGTSHDIYGARVGSDGVVQGDGDFVISAAVNGQYAPSVGSNGTDYLVVWEDQRDQGSASTADIYAARVTEAGVQETSGFVVSAATSSQLTPTVASNGTDYFVAWSDNRNGVQREDIYGARVTGAGTTTDTSGISICTAVRQQRRPSAASDGTSYFVVWSDERVLQTSHVYGARIDSSTGSVQESQGFLIQSDSIGHDAVAAFDGSNYLVAWQNGTALDHVRATLVSPSGVVDAGGPFNVSLGANVQNSTALAFDGVDSYLIAWRDYRGADSDIYATRYRLTTREVQDTSGIAIATASGHQHRPVVASNGVDFLVAWSDDGGTYDGELKAARVSQAGGVDAPFSLGVSSYSAHYVSVASSGDDYFIVWSDARSNLASVYGTLVEASGSAQDPEGVLISPGITIAYDPAIAGNDSGYLVAWTDGRNGGAEMFGTRLSSLGEVMDVENIAIATGDVFPFESHIASNGSDYFVTWTSSEISIEVEGARVDGNGAVLDPNPIAITADGFDHYSPQVAPMGNDYLVVWMDHRNLTQYDIYGTRVIDGIVEIVNGAPLATEPDHEWDVALAPTAAEDTALLVYARYVPEAGLRSSRARVRFLQYGSRLGQSCALGDDCESTFCADGVCCDVACDGGTGDCEACSVGAGAPSDGVCAVVAEGTSCSDASACTSVDTCSAGTCNGTGEACFSGTTCTNESADAYTCSACPSGTFSEDGSGATECTTWQSACGDSEYESAAPSTTSDRECTALTTCAEDEYESIAPTAIADRTCSTCTVCGPSTYERVACTSTQDTVCAAIDDVEPDAGDVEPPDGSDAGDPSAVDASVESDASMPPDPKPHGGGKHCACTVIGAEPQRDSRGPFLGLVLLALVFARGYRRRHR
jgi:hypothetical protein